MVLVQRARHIERSWALEFSTADKSWEACLTAWVPRIIAHLALGGTAVVRPARRYGPQLGHPLASSNAPKAVLRYC